jgi:DNA-binding NtrC family response regulator
MLSDESLNVLAAYSWPGNVRELRNAVEQSYTLSRDQVILPEHLPTEVRLGENAKIEKVDRADRLEKTDKSDKVEKIDKIDKPEREEQGRAGEVTHPLEISGAHEPVYQTVESSASNTTAGSIGMIVRDLLKSSPDGDAYAWVLEKFEKELLKQSLELHKYNQVQSAAHLGITRNTLRAKIEKYGL